MATKTTANDAINTVVMGVWDTLDYQGDPLTQTIPSDGIDPGGKSAVTWVVHYDGNSSSTTYSEGDAASAPGNESYGTASIDYDDFYARTVFSVTGHMKDQCQGRDANFDAVKKEAEGAIKAHDHYVEGLTVAAIEAAFDSTGSYAGLLRSTYNMASYEAAVATLALSDLQLADETMRKIEIVANMDNFVMLSTVDMVNEYGDVAVGSSASLPWNAGSGDTTMDMGKLRMDAKYNGVPWSIIPTMTATTILGFDTTYVKKRIVRPKQIELKASTDDSMTWHITSCQVPYVLNPKYGYKLT
jgi:hypothetical protein